MICSRALKGAEMIINITGLLEIDEDNGVVRLTVELPLSRLESMFLDRQRRRVQETSRKWWRRADWYRENLNLSNRAANALAQVAEPETLLAMNDKELQKFLDELQRSGRGVGPVISKEIKDKVEFALERESE